MVPCAEAVIIGSLSLYDPAHLAHLPGCADRGCLPVHQGVIAIVLNLARMREAEQVPAWVQALNDPGCGYEVVQDRTNQPLQPAVMGTASASSCHQQILFTPFSRLPLGRRLAGMWNCNWLNKYHSCLSDLWFNWQDFCVSASNNGSKDQYYVLIGDCEHLVGVLVSCDT